MTSYNQGAAGELIYASGQVATTSVPAAAAAAITLGLEAIQLPAGFMAATAGRKASSCQLIVDGVATATATIPTWKFGLSKTTAQPAVFSGTGGIESATFTPPGAITAAPFTLTYKLQYRTASTGGANGVVSVLGKIEGPQLLPSPFQFTIPTNNGTRTWTDWEPDLPYFLWPYLTLSAGTAGNTVTVEQVRLFGESA